MQFVTLHMFGRVGGVWVTLSDSRTTRTDRSTRLVELVGDNTRKGLSYPADPGRWSTGDFAAIVMTYGRAQFAESDGSNVDAVSVMEQDLSTLAPITDLPELLDALWSSIAARWYDCSACAQVRLEGNNPHSFDDPNAPLHNHLDEYSCDDHDAFALVGICVNPSDGVGALLREWGDDAEPLALEDRVFALVGDTELHARFGPIHELSLDRGTTSVPKVLTERFLREAVDALQRRQAENCENTHGPIGGRQTSWVVDPDRGMRELEPVSIACGAAESGNR